MGNDPADFKQRRRTWTLVEKGLSETLGTALLLLFGCMGGLPGFSETPTPPLQSALVFGITVSSIIQIFGHVSGAHLNPAVTVAAWILGFTSSIEAAIYVVGQFLGATLGYATLVIVTPTTAFFEYSGGQNTNGSHSFCATTPGATVNVTQALIGEFLASSVLILLCCGVWDRRNEAKQDGVPIKFALTIAALSLAEGPYSGCSMNPARTFGPALITGEWRSHWIYWLGPLAAGVIMAYLYRYVFGREHSVPAPAPVTDPASFPLNEKTIDHKGSVEEFHA